MFSSKRLTISAFMALSLLLAIMIGPGCQTTPAPAEPVETAEPTPEPTPEPTNDTEAPVEETDPVDVAAEDLRMPPPQGALSGKRVAFLVGEGFHDGETFIPMAYLHNRGADVRVIGVETGVVTAYNSEITVVVQHSIGDVSPDDFDALVIPGGQSPDWLRQHEEVVAFAGTFFRAEGITAAICHGPQVLVAAGVLEGRESTCFPNMKDELVEAGAEYEDVPMKRDGNLITSRNPDDIPVFSSAIEKALLE